VSAGAFVLAAGFGKRLRPLTLQRPKPLVPICGSPVLEQALALCRSHGLLQVVVNAHHLAEQLVAWCGQVEGMEVQVQVERPDILGTGGGLRLAQGRLSDPFAVVNGDILCDADLTGLLASCRLEGVSAAMLLRRSPRATRYGVVAADERGRVVRLTSLAQLEGAPPVAEDTHFTGIHAMSHSALERVPAEGFACVVRSAYQQLVPQGRVRGLLHGGGWVDVGNPRAYLDANLAALQGRLRLCADPWQRVGWGGRPRPGGGYQEVGTPSSCALPANVELVPPFWIGGGAELGAGSRLGPGVVIGEGARVGRGARLRRAVVWDGVQAGSDLQAEDVVVHERGVLQADRVAPDSADSA